MTNDTSTLNGALQELGETMAANLVTKGVQASASDGLTTLAGKILDISGGGGSCYHIEFSESSYTAVGGTATLEILLQENYAPKSGATVTVSGSDSSLYTGLTDNSGLATVTVSVSATTTFTCSYSNVSDTCTVNVPSIPYQQVEYLQSNGSQYINTGYILKATDKVEVTVSMQSSGTYNGIFGARRSNASNNCYALFGRFDGQPKFVYARTGNELKGQQHSHDVVYNIKTDQRTCTISENGTVIETLNNTGTINDCYNPCGLFTVNTASGTGFTKDTYGYNKIYYFKITDANNNVIMELYPVRNGTTGYMYDTVSESLMSKTGTFLYGADI